MRTLLLFCLLPLIAFTQDTDPKTLARWNEEAKRVTIIRDTYGVPHVYGKTDADAVFGLLYAQCEENFHQVEENNLEMLGRMSEVYGSRYVYADLQARLIYDSAAAVADYKKAPTWLKKLVDAAADGVNYYLYKHPSVKPALLTTFKPWYQLLRTDGSISPTQSGGLTTQDMRRLYTTQSALSLSPSPVLQYPSEPMGSNGFAVAPSRTVNKNSILYINPHVTFYFRSEMQMASEEGLNAYGAVTWGTFFIYQGFNEHCGWMHTSSYADVADLFAERTTNSDGNWMYEYDQKWLPAGSRLVTVNYKKNNDLIAETFTTYSTIHGPVLGEREGAWLSLKARNRSMDALMQSWLRTKCKTFEEFEKVMKMRSNNSNNTVYADDKGNIAYWHGNFIPKRNPKFDYSSVVDGSTSATNWQGVHELNEIVSLHNPSSGWIQNCNSTPFTSSGSSSPLKENYPEYMAPDGENFRAVNAARLLSRYNDLSIDKMIDSVGYNTYLSAFDYLMQALNSSYNELADTDSLKTELIEAVSLLKAWNRESSINSVATTIGVEWATRILQKARPPASYYRMSDGLGQLFITLGVLSSREVLVLLQEALANLTSRFGDWHVKWGDLNRYQRYSTGRFSDSLASLPVGLAPATFGCLPSFASTKPEGANKRYGTYGNSFVACVEFGTRVVAKTIITGGQSFDPSSPHYIDQANGYIYGDFKNVYFYKDDIAKHTERQYHPGQ